MRKTHLLVLAVATGTVAAAQAAPVAPLALPDGAVNVLSGGFSAGTYGSRNDHIQGGGSYEVFTQTTDNDVNQFISTGTGGPTYIALYNTPAHGYTGQADVLATYGAMNLIRVYADTTGSDPWIQLPTSVTIKGGMFAGDNDGNSYQVVPENFPNTYATVSSISWTPSGLIPNQYYTDISVNIPAGTANSMFFDFGTPLGQGGQGFAEFQGALVPEPASVGVLGIATTMGLLARKRRRA